MALKMTALTCDRYGPPDVVQITEVERPTPRANEILVRVFASAVNTGDWRIRAGEFPGILFVPGRLMFGILRPRNPRLGSEYAGVVEQTGASKSRFVVGDRVFGMLVSGGASAEYLTVPEDSAVEKVPASLSFDEAAGIPFGAICALVFLDDFAELRAGQSVLIIGASGGVGAYAVQIAKALGALVTAVAGPDSQRLLSTLGADEIVDYQKTDLVTIGRRFDVVFDTFGAISPKTSRDLLVEGGLFFPLNIGLREIVAALLNKFRKRKIRLAVNPDRKEDMTRLARMIENGTLRPVVDTVYPFEDAARAHAHVESRHKKGAVVLRIARASDQPT